jgi:hypothetical protein
MKMIYVCCTNTSWVRARLCKLQKGCTRLAAASDKVYQLLAHDWWFSPGTWLWDLELTSHLGQYIWELYWLEYIFTGTKVNWLNLTLIEFRSLDLTAHTSLSPIRRGFAPSFVNYKKGCTRLATASDKVYQLLAHGRWFSPGTPASSTTKTGRHDIAIKNIPYNKSYHQSIIGIETHLTETTPYNKKSV